MHCIVISTHAQLPFNSVPQWHEPGRGQKGSKETEPAAAGEPPELGGADAGVDARCRAHARAHSS